MPRLDDTKTTLEAITDRLERAGTDALATTQNSPLPGGL
jgi:hypothetical protein